MLNEGRLVPAVQCDAEALPFPARRFDCVSIAFGLRNVTHKEAALAEMRRVLKPGGVAARARIPQVGAPLAPAYDWYSFNVLPRLGKLVAGDDGELPLSRRIDPHASGPGDAEGDDGRGGIRPRRVAQSHGRRRRVAPGLRLLGAACFPRLDIANRALEREHWARDKLAGHAGRTRARQCGPALQAFAIDGDGRCGDSEAAPDLTLGISPLRCRPCSRSRGVGMSWSLPKATRRWWRRWASSRSHCRGSSEGRSPECWARSRARGWPTSADDLLAVSGIRGAALRRQFASYVGDEARTRGGRRRGPRLRQRDRGARRAGGRACAPIDGSTVQPGAPLPARRHHRAAKKQARAASAAVPGSRGRSSASGGPSGSTPAVR